MYISSIFKNKLVSKIFLSGVIVFALQTISIIIYFNKCLSILI